MLISMARARITTCHTTRPIETFSELLSLYPISRLLREIRETKDRCQSFYGNLKFEIPLLSQALIFMPDPIEG